MDAIMDRIGVLVREARDAEAQLSELRKAAVEVEGSRIAALDELKTQLEILDSAR